jgi:hypothetical protein
LVSNICRTASRRVHSAGLASRRSHVQANSSGIAALSQSGPSSLLHRARLSRRLLCYLPDAHTPIRSLALKTLPPLCNPKHYCRSVCAPLPAAHASRASRRVTRPTSSYAFYIYVYICNSLCAVCRPAHKFFPLRPQSRGYHIFHATLQLLLLCLSYFSHMFIILNCTLLI